VSNGVTLTLPNLPAAIPSKLLEHRTDIAAAERRMAAANADIGVARSAFYPRVMLSGMAGYQSLDVATLFTWPSRVWSLGPSLQWPIFTGGRNRAQLATARAAYDATVAAYRQTVLSAFQEVEDQRAAVRLLSKQLEIEQAAPKSARRTLEISTNRYNRPQKKCPKGPSRRADPIPFFFVLFVAFCGENRRKRRKQRTTARDLNSPFEGSPYPSCSEVWGRIVTLPTSNLSAILRPSVTRARSAVSSPVFLPG
jgi:hypothetical protein